jgi:hypothetical protein
MARKFVIIGVILAAIFPVICVAGLVAHYAMGCTGGGSSGPVAGCHILGMESNFIAALAMPAFVASFVTVPVGILLAFVSGVVSDIPRSSQEGRMSKKSQQELPPGGGDSV